MGFFSKLFGKNKQEVHRFTIQELNENLFSLAMQMYNEGDYERAFMQMKTVAENGEYMDAMFNLGMFYMRGIGTKRNPSVGLEWLKKGAMMGDDKAAYNVAIAYHDGKVVPRDMDQAKYWYELAAKLGNLQAQNELRKITMDSKAASENTTDSYMPFIFAGVRFNDAFELIDCCKNKIPKDGIYYGFYVETPPCFDEFDYEAAGRSATFYFFIGTSTDDIREKKNNFWRVGKEQYRPLIKIERNKEGYLEHDMHIII